jgi:hypothetical protein
LSNSTNKIQLVNNNSTGDPSSYASNSTSRGMSFLKGSEGNIQDIEKYDNHMINVIYFI